MTTIERAIEIDAPVEKVFQFASDWNTWPEFFEGVSDFKPTTEIRRGNGSRFTYRAKLLGMRTHVETEIREFIENEGWTGISVKGVKCQSRWIFKRLNKRTEFKYILSYRLPMPIIGCILDGLLVRPEWKRIIENSLKNLKKQMEQQTPERSASV